nr:DNA helicase [Tanacetum cinerariifolium]
MQERHDSVPKLNGKKRKIYDLIIDADTTNQQELIFIYDHGETGKTFQWKTIINTLRSKGIIVLTVASSAPTNDRRCFEALYRILRDILTASHYLFRGKPDLLGGDFRHHFLSKKELQKWKR